MSKKKKARKKVKKKARMGRPSLGDNAKKVLINVRVTPRELRKWRKAAKEAGMSFSAWLLAPHRGERG